MLQQGQDWVPACAAERHSHDTNMQNTLGYNSTPQKRPSHWTNMLGGIEKKCSGENILGLVGSTPRLGQKRSGKAPLVLD